MNINLKKKISDLIFRIVSRPVDPLIAGMVLCSIGAVIVILANYANCFQDAESVMSFTPAVLKKGTSFTIYDFVNIFNVWGLDNGWNRPRFFSSPAYILAIKTRLILWKHILPHPTFSVIWILTLVAAPLLFYKFLKHILKDTTAACAGVAVYLSSCGYLFAGTMLMHPGKPLLNIVVIAILYLLAKFQPPESSEHINPPFRRRFAVGLVLLLTTSLFLDEMATFCFVLLLVWSIRYFLPYRLRWSNLKTCCGNVLVYCIPAVLLLVMVLGVAPYVAEHAFAKTYDFFDCISRNAHVTQINFELFAWNTLTLFSASLLPWTWLKLRVPVPDAGMDVNYLGISIFYSVLFLAFVYLFVRARQYRVYLIKILLLMGLFVFLQSVNISFHIQKIVLCGYYYGAPFAVVFAALIAILVAVLKHHIRFGIWIARFLVAYIIIMQLMNFLVINHSWKVHSDWKATVGVPRINLDTVRGKVIYLIKKKLKDEIKSEYKIYYPGRSIDIAPDMKFQSTEKFWTQWRNGQCDLFAQPHDAIFIENLWLYGELCPVQFNEFYGHE